MVYDFVNIFSCAINSSNYSKSIQYFEQSIPNLLTSFLTRKFLELPISKLDYRTLYCESLVILRRSLFSCILWRNSSSEGGQRVELRLRDLAGSVGCLYSRQVQWTSSIAVEAGNVEQVARISKQISCVCDCYSLTLTYILFA